MRYGTAVAAAFVALAVGAGSVPVLTPTAANAEEGAKVRKYKKKYEQRYARKRNWREEREYEARANDLDPAGDYKGYPNWARAALAPKYDGKFR